MIGKTVTNYFTVETKRNRHKRFKGKWHSINYLKCERNIMDTPWGENVLNIGYNSYTRGETIFDLVY